MLVARRSSLVFVAALLAGACATVPTAPGGPTGFRGVPGFDTRAYPGDSVMQRWRESSPYHWVGYYLPAPCHTDTTWFGRRATLERLGWGTAVIFIGEQDWGAAAAVRGPTGAGAAAVASPRCTSTNLTQEHGAADAATADSLMTVEGFARGARVFLDVEAVDSVSTPLATYVRAWIAGLLARGRFQPALYASARSADTLRAIETTEFARAGIIAPPAFWVAGGTRFDVHDAPTQSPVPYATVWQGATNVTERWGGVPLFIDVDVADSPSPSAAAGP